MQSVLSVRVLLTLLLAFAAALSCVWLRVPLPWMIGPLVSVSVVSILGAQTRSSLPLRNAGQWAIGTALGLYFTPQVGALVAGLWWAVLLGVAWALALGCAFGWWLHRGHAASMGVGPREQFVTSYFAGAIGGAAEMTLLAERARGRTDLVAASHSLRIIVVTLLVPFAFSFSGLHGSDPFVPGPKSVEPAGLLLLGAMTMAGAWLLSRLGRANPWFLGALVTSMGLTLAGFELSSVPPFFTNCAQVLIGVSLGVRFQARFLRSAPRWMFSVILGTLMMIVLCAGFGYLLAWASGLQPATMILGTSPGGIAEMAITAKVLQLGVPVVTAFQVCRLLAVLVLVEPLFRWLGPK